ncbi:hypothetical protein T484DRAFT_1861154 [Baffinella frigidus]|nr:hypothetical protein T484DRAFT_1861154 [Cryptophyta sp. CCMP2293]
MVEGPGCTRNGQKVRAAVIGKSVAGVAGSASSSVANSIRGRTLIDCLTLGKELWLIFACAAAGEGESAIRCHFGMNGSLHYNTQPPHAGALTLLICFNDGDKLRLFQATAVPADAQKARHAVHASCNRDVCSAAFDEAAGVAALAAAPGDRMVSDALLDQSVLPGTGNIIKNEALHQACIDPRGQMNTLAPPQLQTLVRAVRAFSLAWCRQGRHPPCRIYNRARCADCGGSAALCKLGRLGLPRPTFWCGARVSTGACGPRPAEPAVNPQP